MSREGRKSLRTIERAATAIGTRISHDPTNEEREFLMSTEPLYDQWEKQVKNQGRAEGQRVMLLDQLSTRFGVVPESAVTRIKAANVAELSLWAKRVLSALTLEDVLGDT